MKRLRFLIIMVAVVEVLFSQAGSAQEQIILKKADQVQGRIIDGKNVTLVLGSIQYFVPERNLDIFCDSTFVYRADELYILRGNVNLVENNTSLVSDMIRYNAVSEEAHSPGPFTYTDRESERSLRADRGTYFYSKNVLHAEENVVYSDSLKTLYADTLDYYEDEKKIDVSGNVVFYDYEQNIVTTSQFGKYFEDKSYGIITGQPRIVKADSAGADSLIIIGDVMEYFGGDSARFLVSDSVRIQRGQLTAYCQRATYDINDSKVYLRNNPMILHESSEIFGDKIDLVIQNETLTEVVVNDNAVAFSDADTSGQYDLKNELRGKTMTIYLEDEKIWKIVATHNAESVYYNFENNELKGKNISSSGQITIIFENGYLYEIKGLNGLMGEFIPKILLPEIRKKQLYE